MSGIDSDKWLEAMKLEMDSMGSNQIWTFIDLPKGVKLVGCKWVYRCKLGIEGELRPSRSVGARFYVDDILLIENDIKMLGNIKASLSTQFFMKDMGEAFYILGMKIYRDRYKRMLGLTQSSYIEKVLKRFKMENSKGGHLPMRYGIKFSKKQSPKIDEVLKRMLDIPYMAKCKFHIREMVR
ncbi:UNVERIFIED_CONTAM: hypothetical protein Sangu_3100500 [Sesamum angustifolium]|uniref:Reverse transcriptase Ty1/copia-type domain-containing protein n=1 Tax=Sesamum angustifolium TaxID=2727405 RepID=A0AAW2K6G5_9LAMI